MTFDTISDLHLDTWTRSRSTSKLRTFIEKIIPDAGPQSSTLVIAGDMGHSNSQNAKAVKILKEYYKYIIIVPGNHDLYLIHKESIETYNCNSFARLVEMGALYEEIDGVHFLDGAPVELDGVTYGGTIGWYDGLFAEKVHNLTPLGVDNLWRGFADARYVYTPGNVPLNWRAYFSQQRAVMEELTNYCDVMITHHIPIWEKMRPEYRARPNSGFFHFDGGDLVEKMTGKVWVYGHTHDQYSYAYQGCNMICNPLGCNWEFIDKNWEELDDLGRKILTVDV